MTQSIQDRLYQRLCDIDKSDLKNHKVVLLPDFFIDHFIEVPEPTDTIEQAKIIKDQGGGNITGIKQTLSAGGNATNTAGHLARLGMNSSLICQTDSLGRHLLTYYFCDVPLDLSHVRTDGQIAMTAAIELGREHTNIMLSDSGSADGFSFEDLTTDDLQLIADADIVALFNWNQNKSATRLAKELFTYAHGHGTKTFLDTGDPTSRLQDVPDLINQILKTPILDMLGINENELSQYSGRKLKDCEFLLETSCEFKRSIHPRIDIHTSKSAVTVTDESSTSVPTIDVDTIRRTTGAGDSWTAANIFATLLDFPDDERLYFANIYAGHYISVEDVDQLSVDMILAFLNTKIQRYNP